MSYCHQRSVGINFNLGFGTQSGNVIRNSVINASCLHDCNEPTVNFTNQTVTTNTTVTGCDIYIKTVTVTNNKKLTIDAMNEVTIDDNFEVQLGSELEIK